MPSEHAPRGPDCNNIPLESSRPERQVSRDRALKRPSSSSTSPIPAPSPRLTQQSKINSRDEPPIALSSGSDKPLVRERPVCLVRGSIYIEDYIEG